KVNLNQSKDLVQGSAVNFYSRELTAADVEHFYSVIKNDSLRPLSLGLNSKLIRTESGKIEERIWKSDGMYGTAIDKITYWLVKGVKVVENQPQADALKVLIKYYQAGDLKTSEEYTVAWVGATEGNIDYNNVFIE